MKHLKNHLNQRLLLILTYICYKFAPILTGHFQVVDCGGKQKNSTEVEEVISKDLIIIDTNWKTKDSTLSLDFDLRAVIEDIRQTISDAEQLNENIEEKKNQLESIHEDVEQAINDLENDVGALQEMDRHVDQLTSALSNAEEEDFYI